MKRIPDTTPGSVNDAAFADRNSRNLIIKDVEAGINQFELEALVVDSDLDAIVVRNFAKSAECASLRTDDDSLVDHASVDNLQIRGQQPFYLQAKGGKLQKAYFKDPNVFTSAIRRGVGGYSPLDALYGLMAQAHRAGVSSGQLEDGRLMPPAVFREYQAAKASQVLPHQDNLGWEVDSPIAKSLEGQFGWNVYLSLPTDGGALYLYDREITSRRDYAEETMGSYGLTWKNAGQPCRIIMPQLGDLIIINSRRLHAVEASRGEGKRVTLSGFGGVKSDGIMLWA